MFRNYLVTALRNFTRNWVFSLINVSGLSLGISCSLLIFLWIRDETSMDHFPAKRQNIYDVYERVYSEGRVEAGPATPGLLANELKRVVPGIRYASAFEPRQAGTFEVGDKILAAQGAAADSDFFKIFSYRLLKGSRASALAGADRIALSRKLAVNFFGNPENAINRTIRFNNNHDFKITAVFDDLPTETSDKFDFVLNWQFHLGDVDWLKEWIYRSPRTYVELYPGTDPVILEGNIRNFLARYNTGKAVSGFRLELGLQRFDQMYLHSQFREGKPAGGRIEYVSLFSIVAIFILLIACINFMNLSTAHAVRRAKEVGIRKTVGALRISLALQFIGEAWLHTLLSVILSLFLTSLLLPLFNEITGKQILLPFSAFSFWGMLVLLVLAVGLVAGSYPAFFLSSLRPIKVLKGALKFRNSDIWFRKGLVVFQFSISMVLIIGTMVVSKQINYVETRNLGFDRENLIYIPFQGTMADKYSVLKQEAADLPGVKAITRADQPPTQIRTHAYDMDWAGKNPNIHTVVIHTTVGYGYIGLLHLQLLQGRDFSREFATDSVGYIINETALRLIGYKDPIGKPLAIFQRKGTIIGVVKDFHFKSLHDPIEPLIIKLGENISWGFALFRSVPGKTQEAIAGMGKVCKELEPKFPFSYYFSDEEYQRLYRSEQIVGRLSGGFSF